MCPTETFLEEILSWEVPRTNRSQRLLVQFRHGTLEPLSRPPRPLLSCTLLPNERHQAKRSLR